MHGQEASRVACGDCDAISATNAAHALGKQITFGIQMVEVHIKIKHATDTNLTQVLTVHTTVVIAITLPSAKRI